MSLQPGDKLGPYTLLDRLGSGGMGEVWKARDTRLDRIVAIKRLLNEHASPASAARFQQEARAIAALNHPNICQIHDVGPDYLVLEYIEGKPLVTKESSGPIPADDAVKIVRQIASALEEAHGHGITHRDLKPDNILKTRTGVKVLDFGLAKLSADSDVTKTVEGTVMGTASYMSPEQAQGKAADARSDIFSFGAVLYELLAGRRAFTGDSMAAVLGAVLTADPAPFDAPPALARVVTTCLRKAPADRYQNIAEVKKALEQVAVKAEPDKPQPSIAVLPFANMSSDKENEYFSDGLAEEILNLLAKIPNLKVIARTSSFSFRGKEQDIRKIAETLNVSHVLEGSVRRAGNRLRVTAQLIHAADGAHLWSERYDRDMTDVFAIQDEIGQVISEALQVRLAPRTKAVNVEAYQLYLKGQYHVVRATAEGLAKAKECFEQALAIDPNYASADSGLAVYYVLLAGNLAKPAGEVCPLAKAAAQKVLALDPANSEAHSVLACVAALSAYDWKLAEQHHRKALAAEPVPPLARLRYFLFYLLPLGRSEDGIEQSRLALETDPLSMPCHLGMAQSMYRAKQYRETIEYARRALEIDANPYMIWLTMGLAQLGAGFAQDAIASLKRVMELAPWYNHGMWLLTAAYYRSGDHAHSEELARKLAASHGQTYGAAHYYAATGEVDAMFHALDGAYQQREPLLIYIKDEPFFDPYHADPRFQSLLAKMNLA